MDKVITNVKTLTISHRGLVIMLAALAAVAPFSIDTYLPAFHDIQRDLNTTSLAVQQTLSIYLLVLGFMALFHGGLSDAFGRRRILLINLVGMCLASLVCALAPNIGWLWFGRAAQGLFSGAGIIISRAIVRDLFVGGMAQKVMAQNTMIFALAPAVAPIVGGWLLTFGAGWRSIFYFLAIYSGVLCYLVYRYLPESWPKESRQSWRPLPFLQGYAHVFKSLTFWLWTLSFTFLFMGMFSYVLAAPKFIVEQLGLTAQSFGWLYVPMVGGLVLGSWWASRIANSRSARYTAILGLSISCIAGLLNLTLNFFVPPGFPWTIFPLPLYTLGSGIAMPALTMLMLNEFPNTRGMASSCQSSMQNLANALSAACFIPLVWDSTLHLALMQFAVITCALIFLFMALRFSRST